MKAHLLEFYFICTFADPEWMLYLRRKKDNSILSGIGIWIQALSRLYFQVHFNIRQGCFFFFFVYVWDWNITRNDKTKIVCDNC